MKYLAFSLLILFLSVTSVANNQTGVIINNGGDTDVFAFTTIARNVASFLVNIGPSSPISAMAFLDVYPLTAVAAVDTSLEIDGVIKDAINSHVAGIPGGLIRFNRQAWIQKGRYERTQLVIHEYLGVMGVDDESANLSGAVAEMYLRGLVGDDAKMMMRMMYAVPIVTKTVTGHFVQLGPLDFSCVRVAIPTAPNISYACSMSAKNNLRGYTVDGMAALLVYSMLEKIVPACTDPVCQITVHDFTCSSSSEDLHEASCMTPNRHPSH